ncbi:2-succinyl-5-enolpyruvyl-6-hydroxy-3-cyclohexene-1-carboxylate synthase [Winogradskyella alexanderae]|uniref:2-succinyl-5-enolpyruvyl-6-hydroxy-3-cyclohexene-1-carboxylate synthase n=1 Tax=Winogradskyella alexanderae TaxID=2877123 RepID=A0ABS7XTT6_9FLAO|nr:2-succinyl-5-enolpyruvyl-6-hydroxy-3-cyclohexene-1-carboxylate synthase [Winogradskyella alexanderae]MCA0133200.1 2-succinyl-5-enolpyruvyl-6-hydroxy-3-cyclohexene-1-carboxylate synthase [Winogradskyella alexanderae]
MKYSKIPLSQTVVALCQMYKIEHVVISPGSRNAPLTIGFSYNNNFKCYSVVDERCAAFFALGIAQQTKNPVALVCTSGSALLNYFPAVSEAFYSNIPLIVLSADRPKHLIDIGDGQTINQQNIYGVHVHYSTNLKLDTKDELNTPKDGELPIIKNIENKLERFLGIQKDIQTYNETEIATALSIARLKSGPVHINVPFDEPLYDTLDSPTITVNPVVLKQRKEKVDDFEIKSCLDIWQSCKRKMILVGVLLPNTVEEKLLNEIADEDSVIVFTETTSNLNHPDFFPGIDKIIAPLDDEDFKKLQPDLLLTFGGLIVSKKIKAFLRKYKPEHHWHVGLNKANDTFFCLSRHIQLSPNTFFEAFLPKITHHPKSDYKQFWLEIRQRRRKLHKAYINEIEFSDFLVFEKLLSTLPKQSQLQVGNSSAIRYTQLFQLRKDISVFCNRGTSGIDGSTSTAIGASIVSKNRTTFITGDLSFFYDSNALWNGYIPSSFRIVIINNEGGGIFRILPGHKDSENFDTYFETKHNLKAQHLCEMYGFEYSTANDNASLDNVLDTFYNKSNKPKLLEIFTPARLNDRILLNYFKFIK